MHTAPVLSNPNPGDYRMVYDRRLLSLQRSVKDIDSSVVTLPDKDNDTIVTQTVRRWSADRRIKEKEVWRQYLEYIVLSVWVTLITPTKPELQTYNLYIELTPTSC